jgi:putative methanogenesis marker protein 8
MQNNNDEHIIEAIGRSRIVIQNGSVVEVGEAQIRECPLAKRFAYPVPDITTKAVKTNVENRITEWGMCTPNRKVLDNREFVGFGASEILSFGLQTGVVDAVVLACDGAGTVIVTNPALMQGIGGRMSGLVRTTPYTEVIRRIEENGGIVVDKLHAQLDQAVGVKHAYEMGYKHVAVTVALPEVAKTIRNQYPEVIIFGVHVTGLDRNEAEIFVEVSDFVTSCASKTMREVAGQKALVQAGISVPIFAITPRARDLIFEKIRSNNIQVLVKPTQLPSLGGKQPDPLI